MSFFHLNFSFASAQFLNPASKRLKFAQFLVSNLWFFVFVVLGYLLITIAIAILPKLVYANGRSRLKGLKLILFRAPFMDCNQLPRVHLRLVYLSFSVFLFLNLNFLGGNIKTENVVVSTDEIVDSIPKLIGTSKTLAFAEDESDLVRMAPEGSFLKRLSQKRMVVVEDLSDLNRMKTDGLDHYVAFMKENSLAHFIALQSQHAHDVGLVAFIKSTSYYESLVGFQMRQSLDKESKRLINSR